MSNFDDSSLYGVFGILPRLILISVVEFVDEPADVFVHSLHSLKEDFV